MIEVKNILDKKLNMPWKNCISFGRAYDLLNVDIQKHIIKAQQDIGFKNARFHAVFDDDMKVASRDRNGELVFNFTNVFKVYDFLLSVGIRPFVELNPMPKTMASGDKTMFYYRMNITPPKSYDEWYSLVYEFTKALALRYGLKELEQWYFEVWNEPNLYCFWDADREEYFKLYDSAVAAVKAVSKNIRVGGPATSKAYWIQEMIDHCVEKNVPIDFVSTHVYPQDEFVEFKNREESPYVPNTFILEHFKYVYKTVKESKMPDLEICWTEWNTQMALDNTKVTWMDNIYVDSIHSGAFIVENMLAVDDICDCASYWVLSDIFSEGSIPNTPFSQTYGLMTIDGIEKSGYHAFKFLNKMNGNVLELDYNKPEHCGVVGTEEVGIKRFIFWNNPPIDQKGAVWTDTLKTEGSFAVTAKVSVGRGSAYEIYCDLGSPNYLTETQMELIKAASTPEYRIEKNTENIEFSLKQNEIMYIEVYDRKVNEIEKEVNDDLIQWNIGMGEKSKS